MKERRKKDRGRKFEEGVDVRGGRDLFVVHTRKIGGISPDFLENPEKIRCFGNFRSELSKIGDGR
jgi:hypothetical protein